jgi:hypothetical protein
MFLLFDIDAARDANLHVMDHLVCHAIEKFSTLCSETLYFS